MTGEVPQDERQGGRYLAFSCDAGDQALQIVRITGEEHLSRCFAYDLDLYSTDPDLDWQALVDTAGVVRISITPDDDRHIHGIISEIAVTEVWPDDRRTHFRARLVPRLALLDLAADCRIYQNKTVTEIVTAILDEGGVTDREVKLTGTYTARDYTVQWQETNLAFISRLMEDEGIFYWFEHTDSLHKLILADDSDGHSACPVIDAVAWREGEVGPFEDDVVNECVLERRIVTDVFGLSAWNFETPSTSLYVKKQGDTTSYPVNLWGHTHTKSADGERYAGLRLAAAETPGKRLRMTGPNRSLACGHTVTVSGHPQSDINATWTILSANLNATPRSYEVTVVGLPSTVVWRPPHETPRPRIASTQTAIVVGPSGEEIHTDQYGRIKVQFHWDRLGVSDENSSCWIRVAQGWGGTGWGFVFLPRIGMEVVVAFLDGDPDRPLVVGCVYNAERTVPYGLPGEKTKSTIKSRTTPEGDGKFNEIRFEDKKDAEEIYVHAQKDMKIDVLNDETRTVKNDRKTTIENDDTLTITKNRTYEVKDGNETYKVSTGTRAVTVKGDETHTNNAKFTHTVDGDYALTVKGDMSVSVTGSLTIKAKEITIESSQGTITIKSATAMTLKAGSDLKAEATANLSAKGTAGAKFESPAQVDIKGAMANFKADGMAEVSAGGIMTVKGSLVKIN